MFCRMFYGHRLTLHVLQLYCTRSSMYLLLISLRIPTVHLDSAGQAAAGRKSAIVWSLSVFQQPICLGPPKN
eukprot:COSAG01_NODE_1035_length_11997_cov_95.509665_6_plen_72_part_00